MQIRKCIVSMFVLLVLCGIFAFSTAAQQDITVTLDGEILSFDVPPQIESDRVMVPMRVIFEALGAELDWDGETLTVTATDGVRTIIMQMGNTVMSIDSVDIVLDVPPMLIDGRTLVPARAVAEGMQAAVEWDGENRKVIITTNNAAAAQDVISLATLPARDPVRGDFFGFGDSLVSEMQYTIRYEFEQNWLPAIAYLLEYDVIHFINTRDAEGLVALLVYFWSQLVSEVLADELYVAGRLPMDVDLELFIQIIFDGAEEYGLMYDYHFIELLMIELDSGAGAAILQMSETGWALLSTYIALVYFEDFGIAVFTLEKSFVEDVYMLSAVFVDSRENFGVIENSREAFITALSYMIIED